MRTDDQVNLPSRSSHLRLRAFYWPIIVLAAAAVIAAIMMSNRRQFSHPGPVATMYGRIGHWAGMAGFEKVQSVLYGRGEQASLWYLKEAVASGRVAVVSFRDEAYMGRGEVSDLVMNFGKTNHVKPALFRLRLPRTNPEVFEVFIHPDGRRALEEYLDSCQKAMIKSEPQ